MKIISKYKDFYDFYIQDYGSGNVYVRKQENVSDVVSKKALDIIDTFERTNIISNSVYKNRYYNYYNIKGANKPIEVKIYCVVFGIYPYIYKVPVVKAFREVDPYCENYLYGRPYKNITIPYSYIANIAKSNDDEVVSYIKELVVDEVGCSIQDISMNGYNIKRFLMNCIGKIENMDVFMELGAPTFTSDKYDALGLNDKLIEDKKTITINPIFSNLKINIVKYYADDLFNMQTYINIENFLYAYKKDPISEPSNNVKIESHGFDLKTSFRNIK